MQTNQKASCRQTTFSCEPPLGHSALHDSTRCTGFLLPLLIVKPYNHSHTWLGTQQLLFLLDLSAPDLHLPYQWGNTCTCILLHSEQSGKGKCQSIHSCQSKNGVNVMKSNLLWLHLLSPADSEEQIHRMMIMRPRELQKNLTSHSRESLGLANHKASWIPLWALQGCSPINPGSACTCTNPENSGLRRDCHG